MHTVIARLVFRWVEIFLVAVLVGMLATGAIRTAQASDAARADGGPSVLLASNAA